MADKPHHELKPSHGIHSIHAWALDGAADALTQLDDLAITEEDVGKVARVVQVVDEGSTPTITHWVLAAYAETDGDVEGTWHPLDADAGGGGGGGALSPVVYQGEYQGNTNANATTWTDFLSMLPGTFHDRIAEGIERSGSSFTLSRTGYYRCTASFLSFGNNHFFGLRLRRSSATLLQRTGYSPIGASGPPVESGLNGLFFAESGDVVTLQYITKSSAGGAGPVDPLDGELMQYGSVSFECLGDPSLGGDGEGWSGIISSWQVESLDDIVSLTGDDVGKVAKVGGSGTPVSWWVLSEYSDSEGPEFAVKLWSRLDNASESWVRWPLETLDDLDALTVQLEDRDGVARVESDGDPSYWVLARTYAAGEGDLEGAVGKEWRRLDQPPETDSPQHLYLSTTGSDANDGSIASPLQTVAAAWARLPARQTSPFVLHFASGSYAWATPPTVEQNGIDALILLVGDGASQSGDDGMSVVLSGAAAGGTTTTLVTSGLTADALIGHTIEITSGPLAGNRRTITTNTATDIRVSEPFNIASGTSTAPLAGAAFRVVRPAVVFTGAAGTNIPVGSAWNGRNAMCAVNIALAITGAVEWNAERAFTAFGIELRSGGTMRLTHGRCYVGVAGSSEGIWLRDKVYALLGVSMLGAWSGWGLHQADSATGNIIGVTSIEAKLSIALRTADVGLSSSNALLDCRGVSCANFSMTANNNVAVIGGFDFLVRGKLEASRDAKLKLLATVSITQAANNYALLIQNGAEVILSNATLTVVSSATSTPAIAVAAGARLVVGGALSVAAGVVGAMDVSGRCDLLSTVSITSCGPYGIQTAGNGQLECSSTLSITSTSSANAALSTAGASGLVVKGATTISTAGAALQIGRASSACLEGTSTITQGATGASQVTRGARLSCGATTITNGTLSVDGGILRSHGNFAITGSSASAVLALSSCASGSFPAGATFAVSNGGAGDAIQCTSGARLTIKSSSPTATGAYGCNLRGGGQAFFDVQPTGVVGSVADFTLAPGTDFADTALSAAYSAQTLGLSGAARAA